MNNYAVKLVSIVFNDKFGNFVLREAYEDKTFRNTHFVNKFIQSRKTYYEGLFDIELKVNPYYHDTLQDDDILPVFDRVAEYFGTDYTDMFADRKREHVRARWLGMLICNDRGVHPEVIARHIGLDRTTVLHGLKTIRNSIDTYNKDRTEYINVSDHVLVRLHGLYSEDGSGKELS